jgi:hypothetical protein
VCDAPIKATQLSQANLENEAFLERIKDYPSSEDEILSTWVTRASLWSGLNDSGGGRIFRCTANITHLEKNIDMYSYVEST